MLLQNTIGKSVGVSALGATKNVYLSVSCATVHFGIILHCIWVMMGRGRVNSVALTL